MNQLSVSRRFALNVLILTAIALVYTLVMTPEIHTAVAGTSPAYRGMDRSAIALECVVNWDAGAVVPVLDLLKEKDVRITFFVSADWALRNPELLRRMAGEGHEIGCLGGILAGSRSDFREDIRLAREVIRLQGGGSAWLYMPADERVSADCLRAVRDEKMQCILYSIDLLVSRAASPEEITARALENPFGGELICFSPTNFALQALPSILDKLHEKGFMLKPVGEVLSTRMI